MNIQKLPLIALRDIVIFPGIIAPIFIGRTKSLHALFNDKKINPEIIETINAQLNNNKTNAVNIINILSSHLISSLATKQALLEEVDLFKRINKIIEILTSGLIHSEAESNLQQRVKKQI